MSKFVSFVREHTRRVFQFALIGTIGALVSLGVTYVVTEYFHIWYIFSQIIGILCGMLNNYFLNYYTRTFEVKKNG